MWVWGRAWPLLWWLTFRFAKLLSWLGAAPGANSCAGPALALALILVLALALVWRLGALRARLGSWSAGLGCENCGFPYDFAAFCSFCGGAALVGPKILSFRV